MQFQYGCTTLDIMPTKQPIILVITCYLYVLIFLVMCFLVFTAVDGLCKIWDTIFILVNVLLIVLFYYKFPNCLHGISTRQLELLLCTAGPTAQHMQDCPISYIQLNYVHNKIIKIRCCHLM